MYVIKRPEISQRFVDEVPLCLGSTVCYVIVKSDLGRRVWGDRKTILINRFMKYTSFCYCNLFQIGYILYHAHVLKDIHRT